MKADVMILAGGKSERMGGTHKGNLKLGEDTFQKRLIRELSQIDGQIYLSYGSVNQGAYEGCQILMDETEGLGPLGGLVTGLKNATADELVVSACDMPYLKASFFDYLYQELKEAEERENRQYLGVVPICDGKMHPLAAIYRKLALKEFEKALSEKRLKITRLLKTMDLLFLDITGVEGYEKMVRNINTPEEYNRMMENEEA